MRRTSSMLKRAEFIELFAGLGVTTDLSGTSALIIEKCVFFLFGDQEIASVDELRHKIKIEKEGKVIDLSLLPRCRSNLRIHTTQANYVAKMYRQANGLVMNLDNPDNHAWHGQGNVIWSNICYLEDHHIFYKNRLGKITFSNLFIFIYNYSMYNIIRTGATSPKYFHILV